MKNRRIKEYLFVDGYNIINSWEEIRKKASIDLEEARNELIETLAEYHHYSGIDITLVFDAYDVKGSNRSEEVYKGIKIIFTKEKETADHYIERTLDALGRIKRIRVATSDKLEQEMVLSRGGTRLSAKELEVEILNAKNMAKRNRQNIKIRNQMHLGRLDDVNMNILENWNKNLD